METIFKKQPRAKNRNLVSARQEINVGYYIRVSTEEQAENPEGSIKNQEERLNFAVQMKSTNDLVWKKAGVYCDAGRSGKDMNRPELRRLIRDIEHGNVNMIMVSELSRLTRSNKDFAELWEFLQGHKCGFFSLRENFDTSNAAGEMMLYQIANFAQFERRQTSERVSANFEARAKRGLWNGGVLPLGLEPDPIKKGSLRIVDEEAEIVRTAFNALITQGSVTNAAKWLNHNGYSYDHELRGGGCRKRHKHFTFDSLHRLLTNKAYIGVRRFKTKNGWVEGEAVWPAMIERKIFFEAQRIIAAGQKQKPGREARYPYLLSTRIVCEQCGSTLVGKSAYSGSGKKVGYYAHGVQEKREQTLDDKGQRCSPFRIPAKKIEVRVWTEVMGIIQGLHQERLYNALKKLEGATNRENTHERKQSEKIEIEGKIATLAKRVATLPEGVPAEAFYDEMRKLHEVKLRLERELPELKAKNTDQEIVTPAKYEKLLSTLNAATNESAEVTPDTKRRIIHALIQQIIVTATGFKLHFFAGMEQIKKGEALASPAVSLKKNFFVPSSFKQLNGGRRPIVDEPLTVAKSYSAQWVRKKIDWEKLEDF